MLVLNLFDRLFILVVLLQLVDDLLLIEDFVEVLVPLLLKVFFLSQDLVLLHEDLVQLLLELLARDLELLLQGCDGRLEIEDQRFVLELRLPLDRVLRKRLCFLQGRLLLPRCRRKSFGIGPTLLQRVFPRRNLRRLLAVGRASLRVFGGAVVEDLVVDEVSSRRVLVEDVIANLLLQVAFPHILLVGVEAHRVGHAPLLVLRELQILILACVESFAVHGL